MTQKHHLEGIGKIPSGTYEEIKIEGIGKIIGAISVDSLQAEGMLKGKGSIHGGVLALEGIARFFSPVHVKEIRMDGILKVRGAVLEADALHCDGYLVSTSEISADEIVIQGTASAPCLYGDTILLQKEETNQHSLPFFIRLFSRAYFGRPLRQGQILVDRIECTHLTASALRSHTISAEHIVLRNGCQVDTVYCNGSLEIDSSCQINHILSDNTEILQKGAKPMDSRTIPQILTLLKKGAISEKEAETMLASLVSVPSQPELPPLPWEDDDSLHIVVYRGHQLLKTSDPQSRSLTVEYQGDVLNVNSYVSITCGQVEGHAHAGYSIQCTSIAGGAKAGGDINCRGDIEGGVKAGGEVKIIKT